MSEKPVWNNAWFQIFFPRAEIFSNKLFFFLIKNFLSVGYQFVLKHQISLGSTNASFIEYMIHRNIIVNKAQEIVLIVPVNT